jgi:hypothetical protein
MSLIDKYSSVATWNDVERSAAVITTTDSLLHHYFESLGDIIFLLTMRVNRPSSSLMELPCLILLSKISL